MSAWLRGAPAALAVLALAVAATYLHTLDVPFYLDDHSSIVENHLIHRWQGLGALWEYAPLRLLGYASFALNHRLGAFDPAGYHLVNIVVHWLACIAVFALVRGLLRTPRMAGAADRPLLAGVPLLVAALFALHPLQTQAVTYVVQRLASLAAMFYVAGLACYVRARLAPTHARRLAWAGATLLLALLALLSKENAATLPLAIVLLELSFFRHDRRSVSRLALGALGGLAAVWTIAALAFSGDPFSPASMARVASQSATIPRESYFATQMPILWTYIRLFLWPSGLHLDHDPGPLRELTEGAPWLALGGHLAVVALALAAWRSRPLVTFGALFYYLAHAVESSVIPIPELAFEHRTYLPNLGLCAVAGWALLVELPRSRRAIGPALVTTAGIVALLALTTWRRNQVWRDPIALWRDNVERAPARARAWGNLGKHLVLAGQPAEAERALRESLRLRRAAGGDVAHEALDAANLMMALQAQGRGDEALALADERLGRPLGSHARATLLLNRGNIQFDRRLLAQAEASFREALDLLPGSLPARANLASTLAQTGRFAEAESLYRQVLEADPDDAVTWKNLALVRVALERARSDARRHPGP